MGPMNIYLREAIEERELNVGRIAADIKKMLNVCKLTNFKSKDSNARFYGTFFLQSLEGDIHPTMDQWSSIYATLLGDGAFCDNMAKFMVMWQPAVYNGMFSTLNNLIQSELNALKKNKIRYLALQRSFISMLRMRMDGIGNIIRTQATPDPEVTKFVTVIDQTLSKLEFDINALTQREIENSIDPDSPVTPVRSFEKDPVDEDAKEVLDLLEHCQEWINEYVSNHMETWERDQALLHEAIVNNAAEKVKEGAIAIKKAERSFDELVMRKVRQMRENRQNRKHAEMVGEALRLNHEIKRILVSGAIGILNPVLGVLSWFVSLMIDRKTDRRDRQVLVDQLKDELEIVEEKINMAERNGDDKARIELIRFRQKLQHEYERIMNVRVNDTLKKVRGRWG